MGETFFAQFFAPTGTGDIRDTERLPCECMVSNANHRFEWQPRGVW